MDCDDVIRVRAVQQATRIAAALWVVMCALFAAGPAVAAGELKVVKKTQEALEGTYHLDGVGIRFNLTKAKDGSGGSIKLTSLRKAPKTAALSEAPLFEAVFQKEKTFRYEIYGGKLIVEQGTSLPSVKESVVGPVPQIRGDRKLFGSFVQSPEYLILPHLSRQLGREEGVTGKAYPVSLPLHQMAMGTTRMHPGRTFPNGNPPKPPSPKPPCPDLRKDACKGCFGMCGKECSCWEWVCDDCCCNSGCRAHDEACRECSITNPDPVSCSRCALFDFGKPYLVCNRCSSCPVSTPKPPAPNCGGKVTCRSGFQCCNDGDRYYCASKCR